MDNVKKAGGSILLWVLNPFSLFTTLVIGIVIFVLVSMLAISLLLDPTSSGEGSGGMYACQPDGELNIATWNAQFENAGAFSGRGQEFIDVAERNQIDPVLFNCLS